MSETFLVVTTREEFFGSYLRRLHGVIKATHSRGLIVQVAKIHFLVSSPIHLRGRTGKIIIYGSMIKPYEYWSECVTSINLISADSKTEPILMKK